MISTQTLNVHLAVRSGRQVGQIIQGEMLMIPKAAVVQAPEAFDARGLVTGEKQAVSDRVTAERSLWSASSKCRRGRQSEKVMGTWAMVSARLASDTMAPGALVLRQ